MKTKLCKSSELGLNQAKGYCVEIGTRLELELFIVNHGDEVYGYVNSCPHIGAPLDWVPNQFLSSSGAHIQCANHHAHFEIKTGLCISGPCTGKRLEPLDVALVGDEIILEIPEK